MRGPPSLLGDRLFLTHIIARFSFFPKKLEGKNSLAMKSNELLLTYALFVSSARISMENSARLFYKFTSKSDN
jgi:hypothetical protein